MVMSYNPKNPPGEPEPPEYKGPTSAERFCDDIAANRALRTHELPVPEVLEIHAIQRRYPVAEVRRDDERKIERVLFMDSSAAKLNRRGRWVVN